MLPYLSIPTLFCIYTTITHLPLPSPSQFPTHASQLLPPPPPHPLPVHLAIPPHLPIPHHAHRPPLHHKRHDLKQRVRRRHGRVLGIGVVRGRHLDDVGGNEVDALEAADDGTELAGGPAACFGGAGCGGDCDCVRKRRG